MNTPHPDTRDDLRFIEGVSGTTSRRVPDGTRVEVWWREEDRQYEAFGFRHDELVVHVEHHDQNVAYLNCSRQVKEFSKADAKAA